jgi:hypothetical protein
MTKLLRWFLGNGWIDVSLNPQPEKMICGRLSKQVGSYERSLLVLLGKIFVVTNRRGR